MFARAKADTGGTPPLSLSKFGKGGGQGGQGGEGPRGDELATCGFSSGYSFSCCRLFYFARTGDVESLMAIGAERISSELTVGPRRRRQAPGTGTTPPPPCHI